MGVTEMDAISGSAGWAGAGLLGLVLCWVMFYHLPGQNKMFHDMIVMFMESQKEERAQDRSARHLVANQFSVALAEIHSETGANQAKQLEAFGKRQERLEDAISRQTAELKLALATGGCRYNSGGEKK